MMGFLDKIKSVFVKEKSPWEQQQPKQSLSAKIPRLSLPQMPTIGKVHIPGLHRAKRIVAGFLFVINVVTTSMSSGSLSSLVFLATALILLDYLYKTRGNKGWV